MEIKEQKIKGRLNPILHNIFMIIVFGYLKLKKKIHSKIK